MVETNEKDRPFIRVEGKYIGLKHCVDPAVLTPGEYIERIYNFFECWSEVYVIASVYITRMLKKQQLLKVAERDVNRLLLASVMLALKWHVESDLQFTHKDYAKVGGTQALELQHLEVRLIKMLDWELFVSPTEYANHQFLVQCCCFTQHMFTSLAPSLNVKFSSIMKTNRGRVLCNP